MAGRGRLWPLATLRMAWSCVRPAHRAASCGLHKSAVLISYRRLDASFVCYKERRVVPQGTNNPAQALCEAMTVSMGGRLTWQERAGHPDSAG